MINYKDFLSPDALNILATAKEFSTYNKTGYVGIEHVLLATTIINCDAKTILNSVGITSTTIKESLFFKTEKLEHLSTINYPTEDILASSLLNKILFEFYNMNRCTNEVYGCLDILISIIKQDRLLFSLLTNIAEEKLIELKETLLATPKEIMCVTESTDNKSKSVLRQIGKNLTSEARHWESSPVYGREEETNIIIETLSRIQKNTPCLVGEPGVGKTAIIEALAFKIANRQVPSFLLDTEIISISPSSLLSGTNLRGDFEERLNNIIDELENNPKLILFIDEIHSLVSAGDNSSGGGVNAGNILKPALARGTIKFIGATTFNEYSLFIEKDSAFERRLTKIHIKEPTIEETIEILIDSIERFESHYRLSIDNEIIEYIVQSANKYIPNRFFPDKAFDILDSVCARCSRLYRKCPKYSIEKKDIDYIIEKSTGVPLFNSNDELQRLSQLESKLNEKVMGQEDVIKRVSQTIKNGRFGLNNRNKPLATFAFLGESGVGKTKLIKELSNSLFINNKQLLIIDMNEYSDPNSLYKLIGAPNGFATSNESGILVNFVKHNPYSIIAFEDIDKAHSSIINILLQIIDEGTFNDNKAATIDFKNCIIIFTSRLRKKALKNYIEFDNNTTTNINDVIKDFSKKFGTKFTSRIDDILPFNTLKIDSIKKILKSKLEDLQEKLQYIGITIKYSPDLLDAIISQNSNQETLALDRTIRNIIEDEISNLFSSNQVSQGDTIYINSINNNINFKVNKKEKTT